MADRLHHPVNILDYPRLPDNTVVIATFNGVRWPAGGRQVRYMTNFENALGTHNLWNAHCENALKFDTRGAAAEKVRELIEKAQAKGLTPNVDLGCITTIAELKHLVGYPTGPYRREAC
ncbi:MAG: hypothetical protein RIA09_16015 [Hoeflea sp.]|jgi:hypothetical protein|uniref:hypothetical protein n=1 Tax=Hoeflea sp. TaxID=1940281 RepID=UPI0032EC05C0